MHWLNGETLERFEHCSVVTWDFPVGSNDEESACNMGDLGLILGWQDPLEKGTATHFVFWPGEFHGGCKESDMTFTFIQNFNLRRQFNEILCLHVLFEF